MDDYEVAVWQDHDVMPAGQQVPVEVLGQDDLGLSELELEYRKDPAAPWAVVPLARFPGRPREWNSSASASVYLMLLSDMATLLSGVLRQESRGAEILVD